LPSSRTPHAVDDTERIAVVIPSYRVRKHILRVIDRIGPDVDAIYVVDDACPEQTGEWVQSNCRDRRVRVIQHAVNKGVGAATISGYRAALADGMHIVVKVDGDGQIDPALIPVLIAPIRAGHADYAKGNRFFDPHYFQDMPLIRKIGNLALSFITKFSSGYMLTFDPTNGFTAIHTAVAAVLPLDRVSERYFFESDLLFHLNCHRAVVWDVPMVAVYARERSSLSVTHSLFEFALKNLRNTLRRISANYLFRDFNLGSLQLVTSLPLLAWGVGFGAYAWMRGNALNEPATAGTVMLAALPFIVGMQLFLGFLAYDLASYARTPLFPTLSRLAHHGGQSSGMREAK
jgi:dolichol-phosphate mannosyltransferase